MFEDETRLFRTQDRGTVENECCQLIRRIVAITGTLNPIPKERYLAMRLFYRPGTPLEYEPPAFIDASDSGMHFLSLTWTQFESQLVA